MNRFALLEDEDLEENLQPVFWEIKKKLGSIPVFYRMLATAPPLVEAYWQCYLKVIDQGELPVEVKELIFLAVARKRRCHYCASIHLAICDTFDIKRQTLDALMTDVSSIQPERVAKLLVFCLSIMDNPDAVREEDYQQLFQFGITKCEVLEALYSVAYANSGIYLAKISKLELDRDVIAYLKDKSLSTGLT